MAHEETRFQSLLLLLCRESSVPVCERGAGQGRAEAEAVAEA